MKHAHDDHYVYLEPFRPQFPFLLVLGIVVVVIALAADWLNGLPVQIVGPVLYPMERLLNAAFFPDAQTPLRPNGSALLVLLPTVGLFAAIYFVARAMFRAAQRVLRPLNGRR
jgi:Na+-driven multidrug efflux pump